MVLSVSCDDDELAAVRLNSGAPNAGTSLGNKPAPERAIKPTIDKLEKVKARPLWPRLRKRVATMMKAEARIGNNHSGGLFL